MAQTHVVLVNNLDETVGTMEKIQVHQKGLLHRAFSVFIINSRQEMLLQKRAIDKYHSGGLWTNACCSHPLPGEEVEKAAHRRLQEEMGFDCPLQKIFEFTYKASLDNGLTENEYDHVLLGTYDGSVIANSAEVSDHRFLPLPVVRQLLKSESDQFTAWFHIAFPKVEGYLKQLLLDS